jgi:transposase
MGDLSNFERGQIIGSCLAAASVIKTATLLGVSRVTVSKAMSAYTNHGKATSAKRNSGRKSTMTLRWAVSKNHKTTASQVTAEMNIYLEDPVSKKTVQRELHKSNIQGRAANS